MFNISFNFPPEEYPARYETEGHIIVGTLDEDFLTPIDYWREADYLKSWSAELQSLTSGGDVAVLLTHAADTESDSLLRGFVLYRFSSEVRVQEAIFDPREHRGVADLSHPSALAPPYGAEGTDGQEVSEWRVPIEDIENFVSLNLDTDQGPSKAV